MTLTSLHQFLALYTWFPLTVLLAFILLIARFYQRFSGTVTYFWLYIPVIVLFGAFFVRIAGDEPLANNFVTDAISIITGAMLIFLSLLLYLYMMRHKEET